MDYLLSREFDAHMVEISYVARSVVVLPVSLWRNEARKRRNVSF